MIEPPEARNDHKPNGETLQLVSHRTTQKSTQTLPGVPRRNVDVRDQQGDREPEDRVNES